MFIGVSGTGDFSRPSRCEPWRRDPIVFAMANPTPEIMPEEAGP